MLRLFRYRLKIKLSQKTLVFWIMIFPIFLVTLLNAMLANLSSAEDFKVINIALVSKNETLEKSLNDVKFKDKKAFNVKKLTQTQADQYLKDDKVVGIIKENNNDIEFLIKDSGISQSIVKSYLDTNLQLTSTFNNVFKYGNALISYDGELINNNINEVKLNDKIDNSYIGSVYSVIGMACVYASFFGMSGVRSILGKFSAQGARVQLSSYSRIKMLLIDFSGSLLLSMLSASILLCYMKFVLGVYFSNHLGYIGLVIVLGTSFASLLGYLVGLLINKSEAFLTSILVIYTMVGSFLSGMMISDMKYVIDTRYPLINKLNPIDLINDCFTKLYLYDDVSMLYPNLINLALLCAGLLVIIVISLRRNQYDNL